MDYIDGLSHQELIDIMAVEDAIAKSRKKD